VRYDYWSDGSGCFEGQGVTVLQNAPAPCIGMWARWAQRKKEKNTIVHSSTATLQNVQMVNPNTFLCFIPEIVI
jgi:hypothetical protein